MAATHSSTRGKRESATVRRAQAILVRQLKKPGEFVGSPGVVKTYLQTRLAGEEIEVFLGLFIDVQNRLIAAEELSRGTLTQTSIYPREVVKRALALNAASVIFGHNHPSGLTNPSEADIALTKALQDALSVVGISVHDHIIVAGQSAISFLERGLPPLGCAEPKPEPAAGDATVTIPAAQPKFTCLPVYQFDPEANSIALFDHLLARVAQLRAATSMITGNGYENFADYTNDIQDDYLWMIDMGLSEIQDLGHAIADAQRRERAEKA